MSVRTVSMRTVISAQIESLGGFKILHEVNDGEEVVFRFHYKSRLQGGASVTVSSQAIAQACLPPPYPVGTVFNAYTFYQ